MRLAYEDDRLDLALSLAESIKWTLEYERQSRVPGAPQLRTEGIFSVGELAPSWAAWGPRLALRPRFDPVRVGGH